MKEPKRLFRTPVRGLLLTDEPVDLGDRNCVACEEGTPPMADEEEHEHLALVPSWSLVRDGVHKLSRTFEFKDFREAMDFTGRVAELAGSEDHHPDIHVIQNTVRLEFHTRAVGGLSMNDFIMAAKIEKLHARPDGPKEGEDAKAA